MRIDILPYIYVYYSVKIDEKWKKTPFLRSKNVKNEIFSIEIKKID